MTFTKQTFVSQKVLLDGNEFIDCVFDKCHLEYSGVMGCGLRGNNFNECTWGFVGPAMNTVNFMSAVYHGIGGEGKTLIENTFAAIRMRPEPTPPPTT